MNLLRPFDPKYWVEHEISYEHAPCNVIHLNTPHARANARQAAQLLETDRAATRREELRRDLLRDRGILVDRIAQIDVALAELAGG